MSVDALSFLRRQFAEQGRFQVEFRIRHEDDWPVTLDYWFGSPGWRSSGHTFDLIGVDGTGGLYCLWHYPGLAERAAPVVFLGSEGEGVCVVADDVASLVEVLAQGYWWFGHVGRFSRDEENLVRPAFDDFANAAAAFLGRPFRSPDSIVEAALAKHPSFAAFVAKTLEAATAAATDDTSVADVDDDDFDDDQQQASDGDAEE